MRAFGDKERSLSVNGPQNLGTVASSIDPDVHQWIRTNSRTYLGYCALYEWHLGLAKGRITRPKERSDAAVRFRNPCQEWMVAGTIVVVWIGTHGSSFHVAENGRNRGVDVDMNL